MTIKDKFYSISIDIRKNGRQKETVFHDELVTDRAYNGVIFILDMIESMAEGRFRKDVVNDIIFDGEISTVYQDLGRQVTGTRLTDMIEGYMSDVELKLRTSDNTHVVFTLRCHTLDFIGDSEVAKVITPYAMRYMRLSKDGRLKSRGERK